MCIMLFSNFYLMRTFCNVEYSTAKGFAVFKEGWSKSAY